MLFNYLMIVPTVARGVYIYSATGGLGIGRLALLALHFSSMGTICARRAAHVQVCSGDGTIPPTLMAIGVAAPLRTPRSLPASLPVELPIEPRTQLLRDSSASCSCASSGLVFQGRIAALCIYIYMTKPSLFHSLATSSGSETKLQAKLAHEASAPHMRSTP